MKLTRRDLGKLAAAAIPGTGILGPMMAWRAARGEAQFEVRRRADRPERAVQLRRPRHEPRRAAQRCLKLNVNAVEMRSQPVESFLGSPGGERPKGRRRDDAEVAHVGLDGSRHRVPQEVRRRRRAHRDRQIRRHLHHGGRGSRLLLQPRAQRSARARSRARSTQSTRSASASSPTSTSSWSALHGHAATTPAHWEAAFSQARYNGANLDLGHFVAGNNVSPIPFLKQHHARITHVHVKDRKMKEGA